MKNNQSSKRKGTVIITVAIMMAIFLGFGALAVDLAHLYLIRNQMQNVADSAALTGAGYLFPSVSTGPNFTLANTKVLSGLSLNKVNGITMTNAAIQTGYWDIKRLIPGITTPTTPTSSQAPAIKVTISKSPGLNGGPVDLFFGSILGVNTADITVEAIGVSGSPSEVPANSLFPMVLVKSLYDSYWDSSTGQPKIDPLTGDVYTFDIGISGSLGQWSSFLTDANDVNTVQDLLTNGNPQPVGIGDNIWIEPGVKTSLYANVPTGIDTLIAIVDNSSSHGEQPILGFGAIHIDAAIGGSTKIIRVHFIKDYKVPEATPGGANYGAYVPPRLAY